MDGFEKNIESFDASTSEDTIAETVAIFKQKKAGGIQLTHLLPQNHPLYIGRGSNQMNRIRGYIIAAFEQIGLPNNALIFICEELENSKDAYVVAAAAKAIRGMSSPNVAILPFLQKAILNIGHKDNAVTFDSYKPDWNKIQQYTTATQEILATFKWMGGTANEALPFLNDYSNGFVTPIDTKLKNLISDTIYSIKNDNSISEKVCCTPYQYNTTNTKSKNYTSIKDSILEDQNSNRISIDDFIKNSYTVVAFFYTRCDNPNKCSLTISKLAQLQQLIDESSVSVHSQIKIAAITYDSSYDTPDKIKNYAENRKFRFTDNYKCFRILNDDFDKVKNYLQLGVSYVGSIVSQHQIELYILDNDGNVQGKFSQLQWNPEDVIKDIKVLIQKSNSISSKVKHTIQSISNTLMVLFVAFFPKCPICWAAYLSAFGISGISWLKYNPKFLYIIVLIMIVNLVVLYYKSKITQSYVPFVLSSIGIFLTLFSTIFPTMAFLKIIGLFLVMFSSALIVLPTKYNQLIINGINNLLNQFVKPLLK
jgi:protein SCO1